jgi:hypothetical protein
MGLGRRMILLAALSAIVSCAAASTAGAQWSLEAGIEHFDWREHTTPIEVHESGPRFGVRAAYAQPRASGPLLAGRVALYGGGVSYDGSFQFDATQAAQGTAIYHGATLGGEVRHRWPGVADAILGLDGDLWRRRLSASQREDYRILSLKLGVEHVADGSGRLGFGGGMRFLLATSEKAMLESGGVRHDLSLSPGRGANPYANAAYRLSPRVTLQAYWDGMALGRSNNVVLSRRGQPRLVVSQPATDIRTLGLRVGYRW